MPAPKRQSAPPRPKRNPLQSTAVELWPLRHFIRMVKTDVVRRAKMRTNKQPRVNKGIK